MKHLLLGAASLAALCAVSHPASAAFCPTKASCSALAASQLGTASGVAPLDSNALVPIGNLPTGTGASQVALGNDARLALANTALQQSLLGAASGVAPLDSGKLLPAANLPAIPVGNLPVGTAAGTVAAGNDPRITGALQAAAMGTSTGPAAYTDSRIANALQPGGDISGMMDLAPYVGAVGQTEKVRKGRFLDPSDYGADGTAANDNAAVTKVLGICSSTLTTSCLIQWEPGTWALSTTTSFPVTSNTVWNGAGEYATTFTWNDVNASGAAGDPVNNNLFSAALVGNKASNITFSNFQVVGTRATNGTITQGNGGYPFQPYNVTNLVFDHVRSAFARLMAFSPRQSSNVTFHSDDVWMAARDGINFSSCDHVLVDGGTVFHTDDDGIAGHSASSDAVEDGSFTGQRRDLTIVNMTLFDTEGIHVLSAKTALIANNNISFSRYHAIDVNTVAANGSNGPEGMAAQASILILGNDISDTYDRQFLPDPLVYGADDIQIDGESARSGSVYGAIPGIPAPPGNANGETVGKVHLPYFETLANTNSTATPTNGTWGVIIALNHMTRTLPPSDSTDSRFKTLTDYHLGMVYTRGAGGETAALPDAAFRENHIHIFGGLIRGVKIVENYMQGRGLALELGNSNFDAGLIDFSRNTIVDEKFGGIQIDNNPASAKAILDVEDNDFDLDPFFQFGRGSNGTFISATAGPVALISQETNASPGVSVRWRGNKVRNAAADMNIDPSATPAASVMVDSADNTDYMQPSVVGSFSTANKGIGLAHAAGTNFVILDSDPTSGTFGQVLFAPPEAVSSVPTTGTWVAGKFVESLNPVTSGLLGYKRLTTGSGQVLGTDWMPVPLNALTAAGVTTANSVGGVTVVSAASYYNTGATSVTAIPVTFSAATGTGATTATGHVSAVKLLSINQPASGQGGAGYTQNGVYSFTDGSGNVLGTITATAVSGGAITTAVLTTANTVPETGVPAAPFTVLGGTAGSLATLADVNVGVARVAIDTTGNYPSGVAPTVTFGLASAAVSNAVATGTANLGGLVTVNGQLQAYGSVVSSGPTGAYVIQQSDCGTTIRDTVTSAHTLTVNTGLSLGCKIDIVQAGAASSSPTTTGLITFAAGSGETLEEPGSGTLTHATTGQFARAQLFIDSASSFVLGGQVQ